MNQEPQKQQNVGMAVIAYILFFVPLLTDAKDDPFVKHHVKQGLALFLACVVAFAVWHVPVLGWIVGWFMDIGIAILLLVGIMHALQGSYKLLPLIGELGDSFNL